MASSRHTRPLAPGARAPEFRLPVLDGGDATLASLTANGPALIAFFKVRLPHLPAHVSVPGTRLTAGSLSVYGISQNDPEDTRDFNREFAITFPVLLDNEDNNFAASDAYGISTVPTILIVEPGGKISYTAEGWSKKEMEKLGQQAGVPGDPPRRPRARMEFRLRIPQLGSRSGAPNFSIHDCG